MSIAWNCDRRRPAAARPGMIGRSRQGDEDSVSWVDAAIWILLGGVGWGALIAFGRLVWIWLH